MDLVVLTNQNSASASEILAGALQDNDKAIIIGRRTFGKGLVQAVIKLNDNSRINLTISRYYTPSGRCIQKPFEKDKLDLYLNEEVKRWENGELYSKDSIKVNDSLQYKTLNGRTVYGGGGVIPDEFVGLDTSMNSNLLFDILAKDLIRNYAVKFFTAKKIKGSNYEEVNRNFEYKKTLKSFKLFCESKEVFGTDKDWSTSKTYISNKLSSYIFRVKFGNNGYFKKSAESDKDIKRALEILTTTK
jgi:carboxyl-terminal processing protease